MESILSAQRHLISSGLPDKRINFYLFIYFLFLLFFWAASGLS